MANPDAKAAASRRTYDGGAIAKGPIVRPSCSSVVPIRPSAKLVCTRNGRRVSILLAPLLRQSKKLID